MVCGKQELFRRCGWRRLQACQQHQNGEAAGEKGEHDQRHFRTKPKHYFAFQDSPVLAETDVRKRHAETPGAISPVPEVRSSCWGLTLDSSGGGTHFERDVRPLCAGHKVCVYKRIATLELEQ